MAPALQAGSVTKRGSAVSRVDGSEPVDLIQQVDRARSSPKHLAVVPVCEREGPRWRDRSLAEATTDTVSATNGGFQPATSVVGMTSLVFLLPRELIRERYCFLFALRDNTNPLIKRSYGKSTHITPKAPRLPSIFLGNLLLKACNVLCTTPGVSSINKRQSLMAPALCHIGLSRQSWLTLATNGSLEGEFLCKSLTVREIIYLAA